MNTHSKKCLDLAADISDRLVTGPHHGTHEGRAMLAAAIERYFPAPKGTLPTRIPGQIDEIDAFTGAEN